MCTILKVKDLNYASRAIWSCMLIILFLAGAVNVESWTDEAAAAGALISCKVLGLFTNSTNFIPLEKIYNPATPSKMYHIS